MTSTAAILALALSVPTGLPVNQPPLALVQEGERLDLGLVSPVALEPRPFMREWVLHVPPAAAPGLARRLAGASRLCPVVTAGDGAVVLHCTTARLRATLVRPPGNVALEVARITIPPWRPEEEGPPLVPFDPEALRLAPCPGTTPEIQGECALRAGDLATARARFAEAAASNHSALAELRLGDLALRDDDPDRAKVHWHRARSTAPWGRLAAARMCELDARCLRSQEMAAVFNPVNVEAALRADVVLRRARLRAFDDDLAGAAKDLVAESGTGGACLTAQEWCRHILLQALQLPPPKGTLALNLYLDLPSRRTGPLALPLVRAAARQAERAGAPVFAANLLAGATGEVPADELEAHLLRTAELFLAGEDRARAEEIVRFARSRLGEPAMRRGGWAPLRAALASPEGPPPAEPVPSPDKDPDLAAARSALEAARVVQQPKTGAKP